MESLRWYMGWFWHVWSVETEGGGPQLWLVAAGVDVPVLP